VTFLCVALAPTASARQFIEYEGTTSAPTWNRVHAWVLKQNDGDRRLQELRLKVTTTCEDATTDKWNIGWFTEPMDEDGAFVIDYQDEQFFFHVDGTIRWLRASGTATFSYASLTADGQDAQLCTTGDLTWTMERVVPGGAPASLGAADGVGIIRMRTRNDVTEIVKLIQPD
jgi:hypothetical protein